MKFSGKKISEERRLVLQQQQSSVSQNAKKRPDRICFARSREGRLQNRQDGRKSAEIKMVTLNWTYSANPLSVLVRFRGCELLRAADWIKKRSAASHECGSPLIQTLRGFEADEILLHMLTWIFAAKIVAAEAATKASALSTQTLRSNKQTATLESA